MSKIKRTLGMKVKDLIELLKQYKEDDIVQLWCDSGVDRDGLEYAKALLAIYHPIAKPHECWEELMSCGIWW